jgi:hypothetical protein
VREPLLTISSKSFRLNKYALQYRELGIHDFVVLGVSPEMLIVRVTQDNTNGLYVNKDGSFSSSAAQEILKKYGYDIPCRIPVAFNKDNKEWVAYKRDAKAYTPRTVNRKGRIVCKII